MGYFFRLIPKLILLSIISIGYVFSYYFLGGDIFNIKQLSVLTVCILGQYLVLQFIIYAFYEKPIAKLETTIKKFMFGILKEDDAIFKKSFNPHLNYIYAFLGKTLKTLKNIKWEFIHGREIKSEVNLAKEIQGKLLSKKPHDVPGLTIIAKSKPAGEIGWDSYDIITQGDNHYIYVWDATGHGVGAGFIMMMTNALISAFSKVTHKGNHILALTNEIIKPRVKANLLMTVLMVRWNEKEEKMYMTGAGHEYLMIYKHKSQKCHQIKSGGVALGMTKNIYKILKEREISFEPNDVIILYSDGVTEAINRPTKDGSHEMFGEQLLMRAIEEAPSLGTNKIKTAKSIFKNVTISLSKFMGYKHVQLDDVTLVTIQYNSSEFKSEDDCSLDIPEELITEWSWENS